MLRAEYSERKNPMIILETIAVAFSMFSAIPMPQFQWNERNMRFSLCAFPLIGVVIGLLCALWNVLSSILLVPAFLRGAVFCVLPVLITGGIHLDGYADTWDALSSHGNVEKKQAILKDPHMGAFAGIHLCVYFLMGCALWAALPVYRPVAITCSFCLSRALSALAVASFPLREGAGLARTFAEASDKKTVRTVSLILACLAVFGMATDGGIWMTVGAAAVFAVYYVVIVRQFQGLSGDLAGWFVQTAEVWMLAILCLTQMMERG